MRHRGPITTLHHPDRKNPFNRTRSPSSGTGSARKATAITAVLAAIAASGVAIAIGTSVAAPTPSVVGVNLIANPGFENGLAGWTSLSNAALSSTSPHAGVRDAALVNAATVTSSGRTRVSPGDLVSTQATQVPAGLTTTASEPSVAGGVYDASLWVSAPSGYVYTTLRVREMNGPQTMGQRVVYLAVNGPTWRQLSLTYTAVNAGDTLTFSVLARKLAPTRSLLVDDAWLSLGAGPAPSPSDTATATPSDTPTPSATPTPTVTATPTETPTVTPSPTPSVTPSGNPGPVGPAMIGASTGGSLGALEAGFPNMKVVRFFYSGDPSPWGGTIAAIPASQAIFVSFNYNVAATAAGGSDAAFAQVLRSWAASGRQIYWTWQHEADDPAKGISQASYQAGWAHLLAVAAGVKAANLHSMTILMAIALTGVHGSVEGWYVPGVDVLGFDSYFLNTELLAEQYAAAKHKPLAFPEFGAAIGGSPDPVSALFAQQFIAALNSNVVGAVWFNNYGNNLSTHPQTLSVLRAAAG